MILQKDITEIGKFLKTHALKGELNVVFDIEPDFITPDVPIIVDIDGIFVPFYTDSIRSKGHFSSLIKLHGIDDVEDAKPFVNKNVYILKEDVPEDNEMSGEGGYAGDFIGYKVEDRNFGIIGEITDIDDSTENALFIIDSDDGRIYIPIADEFVEAIDEEKGILVMNLPEGLIDLNLKKE